MTSGAYTTSPQSVIFTLIPYKTSRIFIEIFWFNYLYQALCVFGCNFKLQLKMQYVVQTDNFYFHLRARAGSLLKCLIFKEK